VVVLAVELPLVRDVVRRADGASSMAALEAALVIHCVVDGNPLNWIDCLAASNTFLSGASKGTGDFNSILPTYPIMMSITKCQLLIKNKV
jgi:hypothetical protein